MKTGLLSLLAGTALMAGVGIAQAGEVVTLDDSQLDGVAAGANAIYLAVSGAAGITTANGSRGYSTANGGQTQSVNGVVETTSLTLGVANPVLNPNYAWTIIHDAP